ncbi:unnamed protein product [Caenorhabditis bovis]|uniref:Cyclin-dependent kinase 2 n=1 Tax=Caenorhabditis bovis TaxID=2654633 RepID=A0A8S1EWI5_9PELO|nr:unnamed protein product [Caenorhabditis bovis]
MSAGPTDNELSKKFRSLKKIGEGTYGIVYKAIHVKDQTKCALKMITMDKDEEGIPSTCLREISCIKDLRHDNIVHLFDIIFTDSDQKLYMVFEFIDRDLKLLLEMIEPDRLPENYVRSFMWQLLSALSYCHLRRIVHRDLKPQNILVSDDGVVKIADFGLARSFSFPSRKYTHEVVTLWYRPPEIILGSQRYSTSLDMWSLGCIFAELASGQPLFNGESEISQLFKIFEIIGTPNSTNWPGVEKLPHYKGVFPNWKFNGRLLAESSNLTGPGYDILKEIVRYPPEKRLTAKMALSHRYFMQNDFIENRPSVLDLLANVKDEVEEVMLAVAAPSWSHSIDKDSSENCPNSQSSSREHDGSPSSRCLNNVKHYNADGISWAMAAVFVIGDMMGAGMISLPLALGSAGLIPGVFFIILLGLISGYTGIQLSDNWEMMQDRWAEYRSRCRRPYPEMASRSLGKWAGRLVAVTITFSQFLIGSVLILICAQNFTNLLNTFTEIRLDFCIFIVVLGLILWPLIMLRSPMDFWQLACLSAASSIVAACLIVAGTAHDLPVCIKERKLPDFEFKSFSLAYGTIMFAYGGHAAFPTIQHDMANPHQFNKSVVAGYIVIMIAYLAIAVTGLLAYGDSMIDTIIPSMQLTWVAHAVNILITAHILPTIIIVMSPMTLQVEEWTGVPNHFSLARFGVRTCILFLAVFMALSVLKLGIFVNLVGGTTITFMTMVLPSVFWLCMQASFKKRKEGIDAGEIDEECPDDELATFSDVLKYTPKYLLVLNALTIIFGFFGGISATWDAIEGLIVTGQVTPCYVNWIREGFIPKVSGGVLHCCGQFKNVSYYGTPELCLVSN